MTQPRVVVGMLLGLVVLAVTVGDVTAAGVAERSGAAVARDAVVLDAAAEPGRVRVAWRDGTGATAVATAVVPAGTRAGDPRRVWVAPDGSVVPRPPAGAAPWVAALATLLGGAAAGAAVLVARRRARERAWDREWARVEPRWSRWPSPPARPDGV